jgi:CRP-like cAMP-binding protein
MADSKREMLHGVPLFARLGGPEMNRLTQLADEVDVPAGRVLMRQGDVGNEMFVIVSGRVRVERDGSTVNDLGPGDWLGEMALLAEGQRSATATVTEPARLFVVGHREFHTLMDDMPTVRAAVFDCVAERIRKLDSTAAN